MYSFHNPNHFIFSLRGNLSEFNKGLSALLEIYTSFGWKRFQWLQEQGFHIFPRTTSVLWNPLCQCSQRNWPQRRATRAFHWVAC